MVQDLLQAMTQFGVAGLMGVLWVWERTNSRRRERQLTEAHEMLLHNQAHLGALVELVRRNTEAFERFDQIHKQLCVLLEGLRHEIRCKAA